MKSTHNATQLTIDYLSASYFNESTFPRASQLVGVHIPLSPAPSVHNELPTALLPVTDLNFLSGRVLQLEAIEEAPVNDEADSIPDMQMEIARIVFPI